MNLYRLCDLKFIAPYFSAMDCVLNGEDKDAVYCSTELSSGFRLYEAMREHKVHTSAELRQQHAVTYKNVISKNKEAAKTFAATVRADIQSCSTVVVNPAPLDLDVEGWQQPEYYAFWDEFIRRRVKQVRFNERWEFSSGCTYEFAVALDEGIVTCDSKGNSLEPDSGIAAIEAAIWKLDADKFHEASKKLQKHLNYCIDIREEKKIRMLLSPDLQRAGKNLAKPSKTPTKQ